MANPHDAMAEAFEKLHRSISDDDAHNFASTTLDDVRSTIRDIDRKQRMRMASQNLRHIELFLLEIKNFTTVIKVLCNGTPYMPYVWVRPRPNLHLLR